MRLFKVLLMIAVLMLSAFTLYADNSYYFALNLDDAQSYRFGFSKEQMTNQNMIPAPLTGDFSFGETMMDDSTGTPRYYASTQSVYIYWRMVSSDTVNLSLTVSPLWNEDRTDKIGWTIKSLGYNGDDNITQNQYLVDGARIYDNDESFSIHQNKGLRTCWGSFAFECTTDKVEEKTGTYGAELTLKLEVES